MKHLILGTAGHIDHGKTSLVRALTGIDTDRLPEEKARGITIELGFAHLQLPGGILLGIVDVPGHERFVRTMVAGVGGMDLVVLVIAADEGVMPQTREHLDICRLLGVQRGVVALTKADLVDPDWLGLVSEEVREFVAGSFLADARLVPVSSRSGQGLDALRDELVRLAGEVAEKPAEGPFRLPVDRVFTVPGFGTVVTGTLLSGAVAAGDEVEILPAGTTSRVRGVQSHGTGADRALAGQRVAVNLQGVEHHELQRGDVVVPRGVFQVTSTVDVRLTVLPTAPKDIRHRATLRLHSATYEVPAQVILLDRAVLAAGESALVQLRLQHPVLLLPGDPFVLRSYSPQATVAGGAILDPAPPRRRRRSEEALALLDTLDGGADSDKLRLLAVESRFSGIAFADLVLRSGLSTRKAELALSPLLSQGEVLQVVREPRIYLSRQAFNELKDIIGREMEGYRDANPLKEGMGKEELKTRLPRRSDPRFFGPLLTALEKEGKVLVDRDLVKLPAGQERSKGAPSDGLPDQVALLLEQGGAEPPTLKEVSERLRRSEKELLEHLSLLTRAGKVLKVKNDLFYAAGPLAVIREKLVAHLTATGEVTPNEFRDLTGLSRKFMIPLLEYFDQEKLTIRVGEKRVLRKKG